MAIEKYNGIIFKTLPFSETSLILDIYSLQNGLHSYIISGVRKKKSKIGSSLYKPMNLINFVAYMGSVEKLYRIKEAKYDHIYDKISSDVIRSSIAMFMIDLCRHTIKEREANEGLFNFIENRFLLLDEISSVPADFHISFAVDLCLYLGFEPMNNWSQHQAFFNVESGVFVADPTNLHHYLRKDESQYLSLLLRDGKPTIVSHEIRQQLLDGLMTYYKYQMDGFRTPPSLEICRTIFS